VKVLGEDMQGIEILREIKKKRDAREKENERRTQYAGAGNV